MSVVNARVVTERGVAGSIRFTSRVLSLDEAPRRGDLVFDAQGAFVFPGLINAHDHLELNHYGALKRRDRYENAAAWIDDMRPALQADDQIRRNSAYPLIARVFIGGLKNLLSGVTTIAHHNPKYPEIRRAVKVRVVDRYGWAHSFGLECEPVGARGEPGGSVRERCKATPASRPFIVHAAEGTDAAAASELERLEAEGCLRQNTVLVHGVAVTPGWWKRLVAYGTSLVWCPASNAFLFGRSAPVRALLDAPGSAWEHVCLGSDSRVTGARDLLDELRVASTMGVRPPELLRMVTTVAARVLKLPHAGRIRPGVPADLLLIPPLTANPATTLLAATRRDLSGVLVSGRPLVGTPFLRPIFMARRTSFRSIQIDQTEHLADARLARAISNCPIEEPGVECST